MHYKSVTALVDAVTKSPPKGPVAVLLAEDDVALNETVAHLQCRGFDLIILLAPDALTLDLPLSNSLIRAPFETAREYAHCDAVNMLIPALKTGTWLHYCFNSEFLFFPFCESRSIGEMLSFHEGERRDAMVTYVVDLYARDLTNAPNAVSLKDTHLDRSGYFALARWDADAQINPERQLDFFGGLRWRFEEHVPHERRRIDRVGLFRTKPGLLLAPDHTFNDDEYNTYACPWHHNLTAAICSFRTAKALRSNPGSRDAIENFHWRNSVPFASQSQQLLDLGLMEPGQWF